METLTLIAKTIAIISACWAIISGVGAWKREFIGKRRIELAEEVLAGFFEIKDAIAVIRNPFASASEGSSRVKGEMESKEESELLDRGYIVFERYETRKEVFTKFQTMKYRFMASFGAESEDVFIETNKVLNSIFASSRQLATHYWQRQGRVPMSDEEFQRHLEQMRIHEGIFWDSFAEDDTIRTKLEVIQSNLEKVTKPCFEEPMTTYTWLTKKLGTNES